MTDISILYKFFKTYFIAEENKKLFIKPNDYPSKLIFSECKVFNINQIYKYTLLKLYHINRDEYLPSSYAYETRNNIKISLLEHRYFITAASKYGIILGPILYIFDY